MSTTTPDAPNYLRDEVKAAQPDLQLVRDLLDGTRAMHGSPLLRTYIPQWPDETETTYAKRASAGTLFEGLSRTVSASVGLLFGVPPTFSASVAAERFLAQWQNLDGAGTHGDVVCKQWAEDAIAEGHALVLVDFPAPPDGTVVTAATEAALNLAPRWAIYPRASICSWRTAVLANRLEYTQVVLHEPTAVEDGRFGVKEVSRYRVLEVREGVAQWSVWQKTTDDRGWETVSSGVYRNRRGETRATLPIAVAYAGRRLAPMVSRPPLLGVAYANLSHFRNKTELAWGSRIAAIEQPVVSGALALDPATGAPVTGLKMGWEHYIHLEAGGTATYMGPSGRGLGELEKRVREAEQEMAALGMSFLSRDTRAAETAEAKRLDATAEHATLATAAQGLQDAANLALQHHAWYEGVAAADAPTLTLTRDYEKTVMDPAMVGAVGALLDKGLPIDTAVQILARGNFLPTTDEAALEQLATEWAAGQRTADALPDQPLAA